MLRRANQQIVFLSIPFIAIGIVLFPQYWSIFISLFIYILSFSIMSSNSGFPQVLSPALLFFIFYTIFIYAGSVILAATESKYVLLYIATSSIISFSLGVFCISKVKGFHALKEFEIYLSRPIVNNWHNAWFLNSFIFLFFITLIMVWMYFKTYGVPLLSEDIQRARTQAIHGSDYYIHFVNILLPFVALTLLARAFFSPSLITKLFTYLFSIFTALCLVATAFRSPILHFFIMVIFLSQFLRGFALKRLFIYGCTGFIILSILTILRRFKGTAEDFDFVFFNLLIPRLFHRIILVNPLNVTKISEFIPSAAPYMLGKSYIMDIATVAPGPDVGFAGYMTEQAVRVGRTAMTPTLVGELYANFGLVGLPIGMFLSGCAVHYLFIWFLRQKRTIGTTVFFSCVSLWLSKLVMSGWGRTLVIYLFPITITYLLLEMSSRLRIRRTQY